ncbi:MAG: class I SAM-dependent methyltransferase [Chloroflexota bacterium]|nr:class I SAM-dependent methyltransferase [Chloroflexota bacterium]
MAKAEPSQQDLDSQYRKPSGAMGRKIGREMARDHLPENLWTIARLNPQASDHILEIGFGPGIAIEELLKHVTEGMVAGIDHSRTMVVEASRRNAPAIKVGRADLRLGDAAELPFADASFDKAFSIHAIYFWSRPRLALKELHRVLKTGGLLVITMLPKESWPPNPPESPLECGTAECIPYLGAEVEQMMAEAGFSNTRIEADHQSGRRSNFSVLGEKARGVPST